MRIVHICIACFYIEGYEYQENVLPRKHKQLGNDVTVISSQFTFDKNGDSNKIGRKDGEYTNKEGIRVIILPYSNKFKFKNINQNYRIVSGLYEMLSEIHPDIIFCHGPQTFSIGQIKKYVQLNKKTTLYVDSHADYWNGPINTLPKYFMQRYIWGYCARKIAPFTKVFWGTLPSRVNYLKEVYKIKESKVKLLIMGGDVVKKTDKEKSAIRQQVRQKYDIKEEEFLICTGGKINKNKNIHLLLEAISVIKAKNVKLLIFGEPNEEMKPILDEYSDKKNVRVVGWKTALECYNIFYSSDLAIFPGTHSVLWENACACELPIVVKKWQNTDHVDVGGNCKFLYDDSAVEIATMIDQLVSVSSEYNKMKRVANEKCFDTFSYEGIAKKAIELPQ